MEYLEQLSSCGLLVQFECLLSTHGGVMPMAPFEAYFCLALPLRDFLTFSTVHRVESAIGTLTLSSLAKVAIRPQKLRQNT